MKTTTSSAPLKAPPGAKRAVIAAKIARAKEARAIGSKAREGKPLAFPTGRLRP